MWSPTHVQVLVKRAKGLKIKGKNGSNDPFVTIGLGKEKFQTSVVEKVTDSVEWMEQCELAIPSKGNTAEVVLTVLHRNFLGVDEFLGRAALPLSNYDHNEKPKSRWYPLLCKPGQNKSDYRGELEVRLEFKVNASEAVGGSVADLRSKKKGSLTSLSKLKGNVGGSLMNIGTKNSGGIKKFADSVGHKLDKVGGKAKKSLSSLKLNKDKKGLDSVPEGKEFNHGVNNLNLDPGVNSDEEDMDEIFKKVQRGGSTMSLNKKSSYDSLQYQQSPSLAPKKPDRSFLANEGNIGVANNTDNLFKFDLTLERNASKVISNSFDNNNQISVDFNNSDQDKLEKEHKKKKKAKKEKKEKKKDKEKQEKKRENSDDYIYDETMNIKANDNFYMDSSNEGLIDVDFENDTQEIEVVKPPYENVNDETKQLWRHNQETHEHESTKRKVDQNFTQPERSVTVTPPSIRQQSKRNMFLSFKEDSPSPSPTVRPKTKVEQLIESESESDEEEDNIHDDDNDPKTPADEKLPLEVLSKFNGKTREDLIKMLVTQQTTLESQGKKIGDLESYIDTLLSKVIEVAPVVLQKDIRNANRPYFNQVFNRRSKFG